MSRETYKEVPVVAAMAIADNFDKHVVVILSIDHAHDMTHFTSYGKHPEDKILAAHITDAVAKWLTGDAFDRKTQFEDFRLVDAANRAQAIQQLCRACRAADHALGSLMAVRDGMSDEALQSVRDACQAALKEAAR